MGITKELERWYAGYKHVLMACSDCGMRKHSFVADISVEEEEQDFRLEHVLCSGQEVDIVTGQPVDR